VEKTEDVTPKSEIAEALRNMTMEERHAVLARLEREGRLRVVKDA
jgi:hypothetical protein